MTSPATTPLPLPWHDPTPRSAARRLAAETARAIVEGRVDAGDLLTEVQLAEEAGVSRTPAREAMLQLQSWGLVRLVPKKGGVVTSVSVRERRDLVDLRATLEIRSVETLAGDPKRRAALAQLLRQGLAGQRAALDDGDLLTFAERDFAFHWRIIEAGGNAVVSELATGLGPRFARLTYLAAASDAAAAEHYRAEHEALVAPIEAGDPAAFAAAVRQHIRDAHGSAEAGAVR